MHVSIVKESKLVSIKGISLILDDIDLSGTLVAVHWIDGRGWEEHMISGKLVIKDINSLDHYRHVIDAYNEKYASIPDNHLIHSNSDLMEIVDENLLNMEIMRNSPEWEELKRAMDQS